MGVQYIAYFYSITIHLSWLRLIFFQIERMASH